MVLGQQERKVILEYSDFLQEKGFLCKEENVYYLEFIKKNEIKILIGSDPYEEEMDILINFPQYNKYYSS